jgi:nucleoside-diphosphate-sugar epimerase
LKILVTGASGFLGKNLTKHLSRQGHQVFVLSSKKTGYPTVFNSYNFSDSDLEGKLTELDVVVHLASRVHVLKETSENPLKEFRKANVELTARLAELAAKQNVKRFIFISSIGAVAPSSSKQKITVQSIPNPVTDYGKSKLEAEQELIRISKKYHSEYVIIRPVLIYGPNPKGNMQSFLNLAKSGFPLPFGSLDNKRSFISVYSLVDLIEKACRLDEASNSIVLAADQESVSTLDFIVKVRNISGKSANVFKFPKRIFLILGKIFKQASKVDRLVESLVVVPGTNSTSWAWLPKYSLQEGLEMTLNDKEDA